MDCFKYTAGHGTRPIGDNRILHDTQNTNRLADKNVESIKKNAQDLTEPEFIDATALFKFSYGLFLLTAADDTLHNGCIINTAQQITSTPKRISIAVNKVNYTHDMIANTGIFNLSVLTENTPYALFERFGLQSGRDTHKFDGNSFEIRTSKNGLVYLNRYANAFISAKVIEMHDCGTHTLFIAAVTQAQVLSNEPSLTYSYYFDSIKPKRKPVDVNKKGWVCRICGYVYEGEELPDNFMCPLCKHGKSDFEKLK